MATLYIKNKIKYILDKYIAADVTSCYPQQRLQAWSSAPGSVRAHVSSVNHTGEGFLVTVLCKVPTFCHWFNSLNTQRWSQLCALGVGGERPFGKVILLNGGFALGASWFDCHLTAVYAWSERRGKNERGRKIVWRQKNMQTEREIVYWDR